MTYYTTKKGSLKESLEQYRSGLITMDELMSKKFDIGFVHGLSVVDIKKDCYCLVSGKGTKYEFTPYNGLSRL